jgi:Glyoxalase-like domain
MVIDHIVYGVVDLDTGIADLERRLGVRAVAGGKHPGRGTHNALLGLGGRTYLEIIARDPDQEPPAGPLPFALEGLTEPRLVGWAIRASGIHAFVERARLAGYDPGEVKEMGRVRPDGVRLAWQVAQDAPARGLLVPFVIDWLDTEHPSASAPAGVTLARLSAVHPDPGSVRQALDALGASIAVAEGPEPTLVAVLGTPRGRVELR